MSDQESWDGSTFDRLYAGSADPWGFETNPYERAKYDDTLAALGERRFGSGLELGCSIGVMTERLSARCDRLLGVDIAQGALDRAIARCAGHAHVGFLRAVLPSEFPALAAGSCDLILISELLYFLSPADIGVLAGQVVGALSPGGVVLLVNWTGETDTPCTGDRAATLFLDGARGRAALVASGHRREGYRLDRLDWMPGSG